MLKAIAREFDTAKTTIQHTKMLLSGAFRYARRQGVLRTENPVPDAALPKCKESEDTYAYSLAEEVRMIQVLPEPAATAVAVAAFAGVRDGELRGSRWEAYSGTEFRVLKSIWRKHVEPPKTKYSKAPVPIIPVLAKKLNEYRELCGSPSEGWMFPNSVGNPRCLDELAHNIIRPVLKKAGIEWHGWHAFRRGLATNLHRLGVPDKEIQRILRHARISVTQESYIKPLILKQLTPC
jgi:integrase